MNSFRRNLLGAACALTLLHAGQAAAADVSQAQAKQVEQDLRNWLANLAGPAFKIGPKPVEFMPAGDHYDVAVTMKGIGEIGDPLRATAQARPLDGGKWSYDNLKFPSPLTFAIDIPVPAEKGAGKKAGVETVRYTVLFGGQDGSGIVDTTFTTPSTMTLSNKNLEITAKSPSLTQRTTVGAVSSVTTIKPVDADRVDVLTEGTLTDYLVDSDDSGIGPMQLGMKVIRVSSAMTGISRSRSTAVVQNVAALVGPLMAAVPRGGAAPSKAPDIPPAVLKSLLAALKGFSNEVTVDEAIEGFIVKAGGYTGTLDKIGFAFGANSTDGLLRSHMEVSGEGLALPGAPLGPMAILLPERLSFRPYIAGVGVDETIRVLTALNEKREPSTAETNALFSRGGLVVGLESMHLDLAGAAFTGQAKAVATSPTAYTATGQITATGFDELIQKVSAVPELAQGVPLLAFAKGIGRNVGQQIVWDISYKDNKVLVNNVDLAAMGLGGGKADGPQQRRRQ